MRFRSFWSASASTWFFASELWLKWHLFFTHFNFVYSFRFLSKRQRKSVTKTGTVQLSLLFFPTFFLLICVFSALFLILSLKMRSGGTAWFRLTSATLSSLSSFLLPSQSSPGWTQAGLFLLSWRVERYSRAMFSYWMGFIFIVGLLCTHYLCVGGFFVTKIPRIPRVWSAGVSSRAGRGGSRSTSQSPLCLDW